MTQAGKPATNAAKPATVPASNGAKPPAAKPATPAAKPAEPPEPLIELIDHMPAKMIVAMLAVGIVVGAVVVYLALNLVIEDADNA